MVRFTELIKSLFKKQPRVLFTLEDINGNVNDVLDGDFVWIVTEDKYIKVDANILCGINNTIQLMKVLGIIKGISYHLPAPRIRKAETTADTTKSYSSGLV